MSEIRCSPAGYGNQYPAQAMTALKSAGGPSSRRRYHRDAPADGGSGPRRTAALAARELCSRHAKYRLTLYPSRHAIAVTNRRRAITFITHCGVRDLSHGVGKARRYVCSERESLADTFRFSVTSVTNLPVYRPERGIKCGHCGRLWTGVGTRHHFF